MKKLFENWRRHLNESAAAYNKLRALAQEKGELSVDEFKSLIDQYVGTGEDQFDTIEDFAFEAFIAALIPGDYSDTRPAQEFLDLDLEAKAGRDLRAAARKEQEDAVREIGANIDYIYKAFNDQEGLSNGNTGVVHAVKALDDARRRARGLKLNPGGGSFAYKDFIIIPNSQPLSEPENISPYGYKNDSNFVKNSNLEYKIINQSDFMKADLEKRMNRSKQ